MQCQVLMDLMHVQWEGRTRSSAIHDQNVRRSVTLRRPHSAASVLHDAQYLTTAAVVLIQSVVTTSPVNHGILKSSGRNFPGCDSTDSTDYLERRTSTVALSFGVPVCPANRISTRLE